MSAHKSEQNFHALHIPDLLAPICDLLDRNDWFSLMRTSKSIFYAIVSQVWREVEAQVLIGLITEESHDGVTSVNFSRFDIYAPFVRQLRVYGRTARYFRGEPRRACTLRAQQSALLPNVVSLTLLTSDLYNDSDALFWLDMFLTPSLRQIHIQPIGKRFTAWVTYPVTSALLGRLATSCVAIEKLDFYPLDVSKPHKSDTSTGMSWPLCSRPDLSSLTQLRRINTSIGMLDEVGLLALGGLPRLQLLSINGREETSIELDFLVSDDSFPSLTHLVLLDVDIANMPRLLGVKQLARNLTSLKITQRLHYSGFDADRRASGQWLSETLPRLIEHTFQLKSFYFDATGQGLSVNKTSDYYSYYYDHRFYVQPFIFFQATPKVPLQHLTLIGISFEGESVLPSLEPTFPNLETLRMPEYHIDSTDLRWFAKIPNLRYLSLGNLRFIGLPETREKFTGPLQRLEIKESMGIMMNGETEMPPPEIVAKYLLFLWPRLQRVTQSTGRHMCWFSEKVDDEVVRIRHSNEHT